MRQVTLSAVDIALLAGIPLNKAEGILGALRMDSYTIGGESSDVATRDKRAFREMCVGS
jgi:hypothetical protein